MQQVGNKPVTPVTSFQCCQVCQLATLIYNNWLVNGGDWGKGSTKQDQGDDR